MSPDLTVTYLLRKTQLSLTQHIAANSRCTRLFVFA